MSTVMLVLTLVMSSGPSITTVPISANTKSDAYTICEQEGRHWADALGSSSNVGAYFTCI